MSYFDGFHRVLLLPLIRLLASGGSVGGSSVDAELNLKARRSDFSYRHFAWPLLTLLVSSFYHE